MRQFYAKQEDIRKTRVIYFRQYFSTYSSLSLVVFGTSLLWAALANRQLSARRKIKTNVTARRRTVSNSYHAPPRDDIAECSSNTTSPPEYNCSKCSKSEPQRVRTVPRYAANKRSSIKGARARESEGRIFQFSRILRA